MTGNLATETDSQWLRGLAKQVFQDHHMQRTTFNRLLDIADRIEQPAEPCEQDRREDRAYYDGARQAANIAQDSLQALDAWIHAGCGGRGPVVPTPPTKAAQPKQTSWGCQYESEQGTICNKCGRDHLAGFAPNGPERQS